MEAAPFELLRTFQVMRPRLHRLAARVTGSVIDGEDAVQDSFARALAAWPANPPRDSVEGWLLRITHRCAVDLVRRRSREPVAKEGELEPMSAPSTNDADSRVAVKAALRAFLFLTPIERSCVVLADVLDHSLAEVVDITGASLPSVKSALHRGRRRLREVAGADDQPSSPALSARTQALLERYAERFNAHDFDGVVDLLTEEVEVEVVARAELRGRNEVRRVYFGNYAASEHSWKLEPGTVEGRPALLGYTSAVSLGVPAYFVLVEEEEGRLARARDFRHARYVMDGARFSRL